MANESIAIPASDVKRKYVRKEREMDDKTELAVGATDPKFVENRGMDVRNLLGTREVVNEMAYRLLKTIPAGGKGYTMAQALTVAQLAVMMRLNPFNGEVYLMTDRESGETKGAGIGIKGLRQCARRELRKAGPLEFFRLTFRELDPKDQGLGPDWLASECTLYDSVSERAWWERVFSIHKSFPEMKLADIQAMLGPAPAWIGTGFYRKSPNVDGLAWSMKPIQRVQKRAEADAIKKRFGVDLPFDDEIDDIEGGAYDMSDVVETSGIIEAGPPVGMPALEEKTEGVTFPDPGKMYPEEEQMGRGPVETVVRGPLVISGSYQPHPGQSEKAVTPAKFKNAHPREGESFEDYEKRTVANLMGEQADKKAKGKDAA